MDLDLSQHQHLIIPIRTYTKRRSHPIIKYKKDTKKLST